MFLKRTFNESGNLLTEQTIDKKGKAQGNFTAYFDNGSIRLQGSCKDDSLEGTLKMFYENGKTKQIAQYKSGKTNGEYKSYYENSVLKLDAIRENDSTLYYKEYDNMGILINEYHSSKIKGIPSDTINIGQIYNAKISIIGPVDKSKKINISTMLSGLPGMSSVRKEIAVIDQEAIYQSPILILAGHYVLNVFSTIDNKDSTWIRHDFYVH